MTSKIICQAGEPTDRAFPQCLVTSTVHLLETVQIVCPKADNEPLALGTRIVKAIISRSTRVHLMKQFGAHIYATPSIDAESIKWQRRLRASAKSTRKTT